jgi:hypothetical protein
LSPRKSIPAARVGDLVTSFEGLAGAVLTDWESVAAAPFVPLRADELVAAELRRRYRQNSEGPLVGFTWGSVNASKTTPNLDEWAGFVAAFPATFVSLQYGNVEPALRRMRGDNPAKLIHDPSVDQLVDIDRFAAQLAAVDAVLAINNTASHLAGALDKPTVLLADVKFRGEYPAHGTDAFWYPRTHLVRKNGRAWGAVLAEAAHRLAEMLARWPAKRDL